MSHKVMRRFFAFADFMEEQEFLQNQHLKGWKFKKFQGLTKYTFDKCEPAEYAYQLDYKENDKEEESYLQIYRDCGWEYIMKYQTWYYFRKEKGKEDLDYTIFSDTESKIEMYKRVNYRNIFNLLPICLILYLCFINILGMESSIFKTVILFVTNLPFIFAVSTLILVIRNHIKLRGMVKTIKTPYK